MEQVMEPLVDALTRGDKDRSVMEAKRLMDGGVQTEEIVLKGIEVAMTKMDAKCTMDDFNLLEIMLVGRAAMEVMKIVAPGGGEPRRARGTVIVATPEGDVHDLGKNIVKTILTGKGYRVVDCGKDCPIDTLAASAAQEGADAIGVSGLITSVIPSVRTIRSLMKDHGFEKVVLLAGGAALCQAAADELDVDYVAADVFAGVRYLESLEGG
jgi:dimethylamine corrinoid protein